MLSAGDGGALAAADGRFVVVEGRVRRVGRAFAEFILISAAGGALPSSHCGKPRPLSSVEDWLFVVCGTNGAGAWRIGRSIRAADRACRSLDDRANRGDRRVWVGRMRQGRSEVEAGSAASRAARRGRRARAGLAGCASLEAPPATEAAAVEPHPPPTTPAVRPGEGAADRGVRRRIQLAGGQALSRRRADEARQRERRTHRALSGHAARFADRQRLRAAVGRHFHHPRPARARQRRGRSRRGDGARDRPRHRPSRRPARRAGAPRRAVQPRLDSGARQAASSARRRRRA